MTTPTTPEQARELASGTYSFDMGRREFGIALESLADQVEALTAERNQQSAMVEKCMIEINRNADLGQAAEKERDALRAELVRLKHQMPEAWSWQEWHQRYENGPGWYWHISEDGDPMLTIEDPTDIRNYKKLYLAAGAQPDLEALRADAELAEESAKTLQRYVTAMDAIYNHNEAARAAVIMHFGLLHPKSPGAAS